MKSTDEELGKRYQLQYRQENLYAVVTGKSLTLSMTDIDDQKTLTGLDLIAGLATLALEHGVDVEEVAGRCWEWSRQEGDLADKLSKILVGDRT